MQKQDDILYNYINGKTVKDTHAADSHNQFINYYPATHTCVNRVVQASEQNIEDAISSAKKGMKIWKDMAPAQRGQILMRTADLLEERNEELAINEVRDTGKPIAEARQVDIASGVECLRYFGGLANKISGEHMQVGADFFYTRREPIGICLGIGAWNYPTQIACWKSAPALACGNAMIFKPSELTPTNATMLAEIYTQAGLPDGVFNVLHGNAEIGKKLCMHKQIAKISLTGESITGQRILEQSAQGLKQVTLELGGKSPLMIFDDADLEEAVQGALLANFYTQGEVCSNATRVFVHRKIYDSFIKKIVAATQKLRVGDPMAQDTDIGALISQEHYEKVTQLIEIGKKEGAKLLCGGERVMLGPTFADGYFIQPAIFVECHDKMRIVQEEIFGPVMSILVFDSEEEVIQRANDTEYGLSAGIFTTDLARAHRVVAQCEAGTCWINNYNITPVEMPFGGIGKSGFGRENSIHAINHYSRIKSVYVGLSKIDSPYRSV